jgi:hypothetical protein
MKHINHTNGTKYTMLLVILYGIGTEHVMICGQKDTRILLIILTCKASKNSYDCLPLHTRFEVHLIFLE